MGKELWLFTTAFPYGKGEAFLENELPVLCAHFDRVLIIPLEAKGTLRSMPANAEVRPLIKAPYARLSLWQLIRHAGIFRLLARSVRAEAPSPEVFQQQWPELRSRILQLLHRAQVLRKELFAAYDPARVVLYSYWTYDWATVLGILQLHDPRIRYVSKAHGFDLFAQRSKNGWIPFRSFQLQHLKKVFCVSQAGLDHMIATHPQHADKFELARLGTRDHGLAPWAPASTLRIASCANLIPLKQVELLAEALGRINTPVQWDHFGDGPSRTVVEALIAQLPANISVRLHGSVLNEDLLAWYAATPVDLFVHTSGSEGGVPVALQEAASFGIPLMAFDAGGVREIVNVHTGVLLPPATTAKELAHALISFQGSPLHNEVGRMQVRGFWQKHFRAEENFGRFCERLLSA